MAEESQERTEQATDKHLKEARRKGQIQKSRDLMAWTSVAAGVALLPVTLQRARADLGAQVASVRDLVDDPTAAAARRSLLDGLGSIGHILTPFLIAVAVTAAAAGIVHGGVHLRRLEPTPGQFNLLKGLARILGPHAAWEAVKTLVKALAVGLGFSLVVESWLPTLMQAGGMPLPALLAAGADSAGLLLAVTVAAGLVFAGLDVLVLLRRNRKATRMTKREVKDELKNTDGDPLVRSHRRGMQMALSRGRMIAAVAAADVVVVNPTHVAVALAYEPGQAAPRVVAKGADFLAARIREEARAKAVPMVAEPALARALYASCEVGAQIPVELFVPVAGVLAFLMLLKKRGAALDHILTVPPEHRTPPDRRTTPGPRTHPGVPRHAAGHPAGRGAPARHRAAPAHRTAAGRPQTGAGT